VLAAIAQRLRQQVRADDMVARLGDDEFAILLAGNPARQKLAEMAIRIETAGATPVGLRRPAARGRRDQHGHCQPPRRRRHAGAHAAVGRARAAPLQAQRMGPAYAFAGEQSGATSE
jgi:GGDEF domain-containing protein